MLAEYRFCTRVLARFRERRADMLLFSSVSAQTLIAVKRLLLQEPTSGVVIAIPHSVLGGLDCPSRRVWNRPLSIGNALKLPVPPSLRCLALSRTILSAVTASHGAAGWRHMHLPCIFDAQQARFDETVTRAVFGFFGALREEMAQYCALVENVTRKVPDAAFVLVGHCLSGGSYAERLARHVTGVGDTPISDTEYQRRARTVTHAVFLLPASHYRYKSSTGIMDAFNYQKPIICLKNPLLDEYAASMGDLGYAPSTLQELEDVVASLAQALPTSRYSRQVTAIIRGRDQFSPKALSTAFRLAVEK